MDDREAPIWSPSLEECVCGSLLTWRDVVLRERRQLAVVPHGSLLVADLLARKGHSTSGHEVPLGASVGFVSLKIHGHGKWLDEFSRALAQLSRVGRWTARPWSAMLPWR